MPLDSPETHNILGEYFKTITNKYMAFKILAVISPVIFLLANEEQLGLFKHSLAESEQH